MKTMTETDFGKIIQGLIAKQHLNEEESYRVFSELLSGTQTDLQQGALLAAMVAKGETEEEICGACRAIVEHDTVRSQPLPAEDLFENCGTGMDRIKTFNVSTAAGIIGAAAGVKIARHGSRGLSSPCGTVDILEALGIDVDCPIGAIEKSIRSCGIGLYNGMSPEVHPKSLARILSQIRFGTTFNIAASLAHPCKIGRAVRGVYSEELVSKTASIMRLLGFKRAVVVNGKDESGISAVDEVSPAGETVISELLPSGEIRSYTVCPEDFGITPFSLEKVVTTGNIDTEKERFLSVISGEGPEECTEFTCMNAGVLLYCAGIVSSFRDGTHFAGELITGGDAREKLDEWIILQG